MILCQQPRLHTTKVYLFPTAALSPLAVHNGLDKTLWTMLTSMRIIYGYDFSHGLSLELGARICHESASDGMTSIMIAAADNEAYYIKTNEEHSTEWPLSELLQTVNWLTAKVPLSHGISEITGRLSASTVTAVHRTFLVLSFCIST